MTLRDEVVVPAQGRWYGILTSLGVPEKVLNGRNQPCPFDGCGGKDRFRWTDHDGGGWFYCSVCGTGDGATFVERWFDVDFVGACEKVRPLLGGSPAPRRPKPDPRRGLRELYKQARDEHSPEVIARYLCSRGLSGELPADLYGLQRLEYHGADQRYVGIHPGFVALVRDHAGTPVSMHRTYAADIQPRRKMMAPVRRLSECAAAVRLYPAGEVLGVAEGIETAIAAHELSHANIPVWALIAADWMPRWYPPEGVRKVIIFGDNDVSYTGQTCAYALARALRRKQDGLEVEVYIPPAVGDWNDVIRKRRAA